MLVDFLLLLALNYFRLLLVALVIVLGIAAIAYGILTLFFNIFIAEED